MMFLSCSDTNKISLIYKVISATFLSNFKLCFKAILCLVVILSYIYGNMELSGKDIH